MDKRLHFNDHLTESWATQIKDIVRRTGVFYDSEIVAAVNLLDGYLVQGGFGDDRCLVLLDGDSVQGFAIYGFSVTTIGTFDVYWVAVDPALQGRGLGRKIMAEVERRVRTEGGQRIFLTTSALPIYEPARKLYLSLGFVQVGLLPDYFRTGDDLVYYYLKLEPQHEHCINL